MSKENMTPLADWLRKASPQERERLATLAGTDVGYLYSLAGLHRKKPGADLAFNIEDASRTLHEETNGRLPILTARELAFMSQVAGL